MKKSKSDSDLKNTIIDPEFRQKIYKNPIQKDFSKYTNLVLSSGGMLGLLYIGFHKYIEEHYSFENFKNILGVSAGAVYSLAIALKFTSDEIKEIISSVNFKEIFDSKINIDTILNINKDKGLININVLEECIGKIFQYKGLDKNITFKELHNKTKINLLIGVFNLTYYKFEIMEHTQNPDLPIIKAVLMSCCVPFLFKPILYKDCLYTDGAVMFRFPYDFFKSRYNFENIYNKIQKNYLNNDGETLGILVTNEQDYLYPEYFATLKLTDYIACMYDIFNSKEISILEKYKKDIIKIAVPNNLLSASDIELTEDNLNNIINICYNYCKNL